MVNTGHPSRACKLCRSRRIKCDETKPHCLKCKKSKRQCPGYRDPFEINLRDETQSTIRKAKASAAAQKRADRSEGRGTSSDESPTKLTHTTTTIGRHRRKSSAYHSDASWETKSTWSSPSTTIASLQGTFTSPTFTFTSPTVTDINLTFPSSDQDLQFDFNSTDWSSLPSDNLYSPINSIAKAISSSFDGTTLQFGASLSSPVDDGSCLSVLPGLQTPLDEQATCYFLSNFVLSVSASKHPSLFDFVLKMIRLEGIENTPFSMAFTAVSVAALAGRPNSRHLFPKSRIYYSTALAQFKAVLKDKELAKHDTSLATAILLSFYEVRIRRIYFP